MTPLLCLHHLLQQVSVTKIQTTKMQRSSPLNRLQLPMVASQSQSLSLSPMSPLPSTLQSPQIRLLNTLLSPVHLLLPLPLQVTYNGTTPLRLLIRPVGEL
ncbi:EC1118_1O4_4764p [Saccharomyces cerevisiae EC1118]|uniref:EC1118_1O4_4764p n=1 Tax=Saccharomyces cerevisiae (strain Lalvin EC1118 / Prise de mousse) TaxID=643680 RepID=C8ZH00_YEAS8|nr:EC1118_1O4_4764p [Saccharomyces cerevisiae EC1118]